MFLPIYKKMGDEIMSDEVTKWIATGAAMGLLGIGTWVGVNDTTIQHKADAADVAVGKETVTRNAADLAEVKDILRRLYMNQLTSNNGHGEEICD